MEFAAMGRLSVRITVADVGKRVSVRRLSEAGDAGGRFTDTIGVLTSWDDGVLVITRRTGEGVRIAESALVAGKVVPAAPARRRGPSTSYEELARVAARSWQPVESERLGDWELRAAVREVPGEGRFGAPGARRAFTRRANSVLPLGDPGMPLDAALTRVRTWYARRGVPPYIQTATGADGTQELLCARLEEHGWVREVSAELRIAALAALADGGSGAADGSREEAVRRVALSRSVDRGWLLRYNRSGGSGGTWSEPGPQVRAVLTAGPSVWFAAVPGDGGGNGAEPVRGGHGVSAGGDRGAAGGDGASGQHPAVPAAIGRCVVDGRWAGFMAVEVDPAARRRGLATAVMTALARQALAEGASAAWLQVESDNSGAQALYDGMGFDVHHLYHQYRG